MDLWVTPNGTARPDEVLGVLGLGDVLAAGAVLERTRLELTDENPTPGAGMVLPTGGADTLVRPACPAGGPEAEGVDRRSTPLIPGPLSFDS